MFCDLRNFTAMSEQLKPQEDQMQRAVQASFEMYRKLGELASLFHSHNLPTPNIDIGINTVLVNVGNMGSRHAVQRTRTQVSGPDLLQGHAGQAAAGVAVQNGDFTPLFAARYCHRRTRCRLADSARR